MKDKSLKVNGRIICGDNFDILYDLAEAGLQVDLIYLDPPFFSGRNYEIIWEKPGETKETRRFEDTLKHFKNYKPNEQNPETAQYDERMSGGIKKYIYWMRDKLKQMHHVLKPTGSIYLHCDWHAGHYLKVMMDDIFGYKNFRNEIIWHYTKMNNATKNWIQNHDTILFYTKSSNYTFNVQYSEKKSALYERLAYLVDNDNKLRWYKAKTIKQQLLDSYIKSATKRLGRSLKDKDVIIDFTLKDKKKYDNVWYIPFLKGNSKEYKGYPTQKPQALLERIILASSNKDDTVLDPFCGCGTAVEVAQKLGRNFIAIDVSPKACRLIAKGVGIERDDIEGMPMTRKHIERMSPHEFQEWVCKIMNIRNTSLDSSKPSGPDKGFDGEIISPKVEKYLRGCPVQVKQSEGVGVNVVRNLIGVMVSKGVKYGFIIAHSFGSGAIELTSELLLDNKYSITLITTDELIEIHQGEKYPYETKVKRLEE